MSVRRYYFPYFNTFRSEVKPVLNEYNSILLIKSLDGIHDHSTVSQLSSSNTDLSLYRHEAIMIVNHSSFFFVQNKVTGGGLPYKNDEGGRCTFKGSK